MAQYRQSGTERFPLRGNGVSDAPDHVAIGIRTSLHKPGRTRRSGRSQFRISTSALSLVLLFLILLLLTLLAYLYLSLSTTTGEEINSSRAQEDDSRNDSDFLTNITRTETSKVLRFGKGSVTHGRDSRYWDKDDRRRDEDYNEDSSVSFGNAESTRTNDVPVDVKNSKKKSGDDDFGKSSSKKAGLYNEAGRNELKIYEAEYEASLKNHQQSNDEYLEKGHDVIDADDEYDDGIDSQEAQMEEYDDTTHQNGDHFSEEKLNDEGTRESVDLPDSGVNYENVSKKGKKVPTNYSAQYSRNLDEVDTNSRHAGSHTSKRSRSDSKRKAKRRKFSGFSFVKEECLLCYVHR